jgi:acetyl-CoA carboxylase carboxyltransferase component
VVDSVIDPCVTRQVLTCAPVTLRTNKRANLPSREHGNPPL